MFLMVVGITVFGQSKDPAAMLERVKANYSKLGAFSSDFEFEIDMPESENQVMEGKLYLKGEKYRLVTDDQEIISDNINIWHWTKSVNEVQVNYYDNDEEILSPSDIFSMYMEGFAYKLVAETHKSGKNVALIELIPSRRSKEFFKVKVVIDTDSDELVQMQIFFKDGIVYTFKIKSQQPASLEDDFFSFAAEKFPEVEVIDLR